MTLHNLKHDLLMLKTLSIRTIYLDLNEQFVLIFFITFYFVHFNNKFLNEMSFLINRYIY